MTYIARIHRKHSPPFLWTLSITAELPSGPTPLCEWFGAFGSDLQALQEAQAIVKAWVKNNVTFPSEARRYFFQRRLVHAQEQFAAARRSAPAWAQGRGVVNIAKLKADDDCPVPWPEDKRLVTFRQATPRKVRRGGRVQHVHRSNISV